MKSTGTCNHTSEHFGDFEQVAVKGWMHDQVTGRLCKVISYQMLCPACLETTKKSGMVAETPEEELTWTAWGG